MLLRSNTIHDAPASQRLFELNTLAHSEGWELFLARYKAKVLGEVETQALDPATSPERTALLKQARQFLIHEFSPDKILNSMISAAKTDKIREDRETQ